jgi:antibiotic biosynthesis monooxygenase (ABM) superfamily enzyme
MMMAGAKFPGFWSGEIIPPDEAHESHDWKLVQRFSTADQAKAWQQSEPRNKLVTELSGSGAIKLSDEIAHFDSTFGNVATAIVTDVKPGMEDEYFAWETKIQTVQAGFPGYRGAYLQPPPPGRTGQWATLLRFDKPETLEKWFASPARKELLAEANDIVLGTKFQSMSNSFPGWFPVDKETGKGPANWKTAMLVLLGLFPVVMLEIRFLTPFEAGWNGSLKSFINLVISVIITTWVTTPIFIKQSMWWLFPSKEDPSADLKGTLIMVALFVAEILLMWNLLAP